MNNKSRIALAIASALGTVAMGASAQTSTVQIGGSLNMFYQISKPGGNAGGAKHDNLSLSEPELWIHGEEKLSGDMTAWFRCTSTLDLMGTCATTGTSFSGANTLGQASSVAAAGAGQWCGRNSGLGFKGSWGNVFAGMWDTPSKIVASEIRGWWGGTASLTGGFANVVYNGSTNGANSGNTFYERRVRSINYHSPSFSGFSVNVSTSASNEQTRQTTAALQTLNPRTIGLSGQYNNGPLYLAIAYEQHKDFNPAGSTTVLTPATVGTVGGYTGGTDTNWTFAARYTFSFGTRLSGLYSKSTYDVVNGTELKKNAYAIFVDHKLSGPHSIKGQYYRAGDSKGNSAIAVGGHAAPGVETGAYGWALAYMYDFSKRTQAGFVYGKIHNDLNSAYTRGVSAATAGQSQTSYGLNVRHRF